MKEAVSAVGGAENPVCGDIMTLRIEVIEDVIQTASFDVRGCRSSKAAGGALVKWARGQSIDEAARIMADDVIVMLEELPGFRRHAAVLTVDALRSALRDYEERRGTCRNGV